MTKYIVATLDANFFAFIETPTGTSMFSGNPETPFDAGGRIINCKSIEKTRSDGYALGTNIFALLIPQSDAELAAINSASLSIVAEFETAQEFSQTYYSC